MSDFSVPVVQIQKFGKHPKADTLSITQVRGENVIFKTGDFQVGDLAVYVPADSIVPPTVPGTEFLDKYKRRVRPIRLRDIYSEGLLLPLKSVVPMQGDIQDLGRALAYQVGVDLADLLGITKHEEQLPPHMAGQAVKDPCPVPKYDIEPYKRYSDIFTALVGQDRVIVTEKLHGTNARFLAHQGEFFAGSRNLFWKQDDRNLYWAMARKYQLAEQMLGGFAGLVLYGEIFGQVQDLKYDALPGECWLRLFDIYDWGRRRWLDWDDVAHIAEQLNVQTVPVLYDGPFSPEVLKPLVEGKSAIASHFREGIVVKPAVERYEAAVIGRPILKWVSETYKLRKNGTELH